MANIFASPKQQSLFPSTFTTINISKEEYHNFFKYEITLLEILLLLLHREALESTIVIGFLLWLERQGYSSSGLPKMIIKSSTPVVINQVANEVVTCFKVLLKKANNLMLEGSSKSYNISQLQCFLDKKCIDLVELYNHGELISKEVICIAKDISSKAFDEILGQNYGITSNFLCQKNRVSPLIDFNQSKTFYKKNSSAGSMKIESEEELPADHRTIFLTFSKGYWVSENEILHFFTSMFGDFIQSIHMNPVEPGTQPLFARIMVRSVSLVRAVTERDGPHGKSKYTINGKHVWAINGKNVCARNSAPQTPNKVIF